MRDQFYTPPELASVLVRCLPKSFQPQVVADFAAGAGSLLSAAQAMWPRAQKVANDISPATVKWLKGSHPQWTVANADFLSDRSVRASRLRAWMGKVDLVLLNPPFSQRSRTPVPVTYRGEAFGASRAVAFLVKSLGFADPKGYVVAVLPDGCLVGKCDEKIWRRLKQDFHIEVLRDNSNSTFAGVRARTSLVRISAPSQDLGLSGQVTIAAKGSPMYDLQRGRLQMHSVKPSRSQHALPLIHTSHLVHGSVSEDSVRVVAKQVVRGPALLVPRVGRVTPAKVCVLEMGRRVVLSDCVMAIELTTNAKVAELRKNILNEWVTFAEAYRGTGAPHLTLERARRALHRIEELTAKAAAANYDSNEQMAGADLTAS